jgi:predicted nucleotide-binding protein
MHVCQYDGTGEIEVQGHPPNLLGKATTQALENHKKPMDTKKGISMSAQIDPRKVFVVYGRNSKARVAVFDFLRAIDLAPMEWEEVIAATGKSSPFIGEALEAGFSIAQAAIVLLTGEDMARAGKRYLKLDDTNDEKVLTPQPRPNVLFEAGMALGKHPDRTVLVSLGSYRKFSDIDGRHLVQLSNKTASRQAMVDRLKRAGCAVNVDNKSDWHERGDFDSAIEDADVAVGKSRLRLRAFKRDYRFDNAATFKRKLWIEFRNESDEVLSLRNPYLKKITGGIEATIRAGTFQLQLGNTWCPEKIGAQQINLPPGDLCRLWAEPDEELQEPELKKLCRADAPFGSVILTVNGEEITIPV